MKVLLTGGAGYIGSHTAVELLNQNIEVSILDNFSNSYPSVIERIFEITGKTIDVLNCDLRDYSLAKSMLENQKYDAVIHFAGLKSVSESKKDPLNYYQVNLLSTINILKIVSEIEIKNFIFSSSATVYGETKSSNVSEEDESGASITTPYGWSKAMCEQIIIDQTQAIEGLCSTILRYFNPVGAHPTGLIGEKSTNTPNNLFPRLLNAAKNNSVHLPIFGNDYPTIDGTGVRDYIHVIDLAKGHVAALSSSLPGTHIYNLGTGKGLSVLQAINIFENATGQKVNYQFEPRREGDQAEVVANVAKIEQVLGWKSRLTFEEACIDGWNWQIYSEKM